jgi:outer membrane protein assembly factor BamC
MKFLMIGLSIVLLTGCSTVSNLLPDDKREAYKKSEPLPDLEVPPDLTASSANTSMNIPGETQASLADFQQRQAQRSTASPAPSAQVAVENDDDNFVVVKGTSTDVWPRLRQFFNNKGFSIDLDDAEMGALGTGWSQTEDVLGNPAQIRYKIFSEPGAELGLIVLYISNNLQLMINGSWTDTGKDVEAEKMIAGELNLYFGNNTAIATAPVQSGQSGLNLERTSDGSILYLPHEYTYAWAETEKAMQKAGLVINKSNQSQGIYTIAYYDNDTSTTSEKKGLVSRLAFWRKDEKQADGTLYNISLTGAGDKTELIVLNEEGGWDNSDAAERIIQLIREQYTL